MSSRRSSVSKLYHKAQHVLDRGKAEGIYPGDGTWSKLDEPSPTRALRAFMSAQPFHWYLIGANLTSNISCKVSTSLQTMSAVPLMFSTIYFLDM